MDFIVSYSGGIGSFCAAHRMKELHPTSSIKLVFCDTLIEDEDLYRFLDESAAALRLPLIKLADGRNPWEVFRDIKFQGNSRVAPCSRILKRDVLNKWLEAEYQNGNATLVLGISFEEQERLGRAQKNNTYPVIAPLCDKPWLFPAQRLDLLASYKVAPPRLYALGFPHNNCGGFCVRAGLTQFKMLKQNFPDRFKWHMEQQEALGLGHPFLRKVTDGETKYISLKEFDKMNPNECGEFDFGGCACFVDDGDTSNGDLK